MVYDAKAGRGGEMPRDEWIRKLRQLHPEVGWDGGDVIYRPTQILVAAQWNAGVPARSTTPVRLPMGGPHPAGERERERGVSRVRHTRT